MKLGNVRPEHFHMLANLRHRAHRRPCRFDRVALFNGNSGGDAFDAIDLRFVHAIEELPRVRRESFDVTALTLGKKSVESQRAFAGSARASNDDQTAKREIEIKILEIVVSDAAQSNGWSCGPFGHNCEM
jgi:hypothetical protein